MTDQKLRQNIPTGLRCPKCGRELVLMHRKADARPFIACRGWYGSESCDYTSNAVPEHVKARASGTPMLPLPGLDGTPAPPAVARSYAVEVGRGPVVMDPVAGARGREVGMARSGGAAETTDPGWAERMVEAVRRTAVELALFVSDDVWTRADLADQAVAQRKALGSVMRRAASLGYCEKAARFVPTRQATRHRAPVQGWRSLLFRGRA